MVLNIIEWLPVPSLPPECKVANKSRKCLFALQNCNFAYWGQKKVKIESTLESLGTKERGKRE